MDPHDILRWSAGLAAGVVGLTSLEVLASIRDYDKGGVFDCTITPFSYRLERWSRWLPRSAFRPSVGLVRALALGRLVLAVVLCLPGVWLPALALCAGGVVILGVLQSRLTSGKTEFGEQMVKVVLGGAALGWLGGSESSIRWAVWFIAAQISLSYCAAGLFKLTSPPWRSGEVLWTILSMNPWRNVTVARWLRERQQWSWFVAWTTMIWETTFPLALIAPPWAMAIWLVTGVLFHLGCAGLMGLNSYLWAFVAAYPAVVFVNYALRAWLS